MGIYFAVYFIFFLFSLWDLFIADRRKFFTIILMCLLGTIMIVFAGIRWETGTDWDNYQYYFKIIDIRPIGDTAMEIGYEFIVRGFKTFVSSQYTAFLIFCAAFIVVLTYSVLYKFSPFPLFSLFLLFSYSFVGSGFGVRQDLAIALCLTSLVFIQQQSLIKFLLVVVSAAMIHNSALVFIPAFWIFNFKWNVMKAIVTLSFTVICIVFSENIMSAIGTMVSTRKVELYLTMGMEAEHNPYQVLAKALLGRLFFFFIIVWFVDYQNDDKKLYNGLFNLYVFGIIIFSIFSPINMIFGRLARFYDIYQILLLPMAYSFAIRFYKIIIFLLLSAFSVLKFKTALGDSEGTFLPYKTILNK